MNDVYEKMFINAQKHKYIYHYTSKESLERIITNNSFRLSRLDLVNDPEENKRITSIWNKKIFVACFTNTLNNEEYFVNHYAKDGARIVFKTENLIKAQLFYDESCKNAIPHFSETNLHHTSYKELTDWEVFDNSLLDIFYSDDISEFDGSYGESNAGIIKSKIGSDRCGISRNWGVESETRLRVALRPLGLENIYNREKKKHVQPFPPFEYIFLDISKCIKEVKDL